MMRWSRRTLLAVIGVSLSQAACLPGAVQRATTPTGAPSADAGGETTDRKSGEVAGPTARSLPPPTAAAMSPVVPAAPATRAPLVATPTVGQATAEAGLPATPKKMRPGIDVLLAERLDLVAGKRIGLVTNHTALTASGESSIDALHRRPELRLIALFGPEHGIRGDAQDGALIDSTTDRRTGVPIFSLYGETRRPTAKMLANLDVLLFDIQDVGTRFYTYASTMAYVMQAAAAHGKRVVVLDRPNPIGGVAVEGPVLERGQESFVGLYPIALRHGLTMGELARLFNDAFGIRADLAVVPAAGWRRGRWFDQTGLPWVRPSPNLPTLAAVTLYPATGLLEATNIAEGRGTPHPFENVGAPWIDGARWAAALAELDLPGVVFRPTGFVPDARKYAGQRCGGVFVEVIDRDRFRPVETGLYLIATARKLYPQHFAWRDGFDLMIGNAWLRPRLAVGDAIADLVNAWQGGLAEFQAIRQRALLYPT
ncbi:MAG: DUF1343 domain-containing protein [Chloroflexi bacterium]|nr:DUF1343 domain-containing protein [Chloroflexota bacterium]